MNDTTSVVEVLREVKTVLEKIAEYLLSIDKKTKEPK